MPQCDHRSEFRPQAAAAPRCGGAKRHPGATDFVWSFKVVENQRVIEFDPRIVSIVSDLASPYTPRRPGPEKAGTSDSEWLFAMTAMLLPPDYHPSDDEDFMNPMMLEYFRRKLLKWRAELLAESNATLSSLQDGGIQEPDLTDRASAETDRSLELRTRDRERKLLSKIDSAMRRIEDGSYGFCEETGEPIGVKRLEARPTATLSLEAQERHERLERTHRDD
ncbi:RNA polymerase-binding protein DksA [Inquilinus ginsengisoli]|uniref:RNA polymerase-binding transcription factor DksA n=2 Tax=Rhodospirillaceae TaxID=41295 RepID=A0ABU1JZ10_9PROT|nr:RNA polymerase-binding protein DksA [Inquilinus ginsengisoli]